MPTLRTPAGPIEFEPTPYTELLVTREMSDAADPAPNDWTAPFWKQIGDLEHVVAFQSAIMEAQGKNIAERDQQIAMILQNNDDLRKAQQGLGISHDRAVARVAELEAVLQAASDKPAPTPPAPAADPAPAAKNPEAFARSAEDRSRQDAAVGRWASR